MVGLLLPVGQRRMSSWWSHQHDRNPRSTEPGTDFYCPIGTPVLAPADGSIYSFGTSIAPATGRWVGIDFDFGMSFRALHLKSLRRTTGRVRRGEVIGYSGASGYGEEDWSWNPATGGAHVHATLWPTHNKRFGYDRNGDPYTVDFMDYADTSATAGGGSNPFEEDDMPLNDTDLQKISDKVAATVRDWVRFNVPGRDVTTFDTFVRDTYGTLDALIRAVREIPGTDVSDIADAIWEHRLQHPLNPSAQLPAGEFLRYEPAEHENTRRAIAALGTAVVPDFDYERVAAEIAERFPELDPHAFAVAAADEADRRERERLG